MRVTALSKGYYGGHLYEEGEKFEFTPVKKPKGFEGEWGGDKPGKWMKATGDEPELKEGEEEDLGGSYTFVKEGNKWNVLDPDGDLIEGGEGLKKAEATSMVDDLNKPEDDE